jgi:hypothetical protein
VVGIEVFYGLNHPIWQVERLFTGEAAGNLNEMRLRFPGRIQSAVGGNPNARIIPVD